MLEYFNNTALIWASLIGNLKVVRELLSHKETKINIKGILNRKAFIIFKFIFLNEIFNLWTFMILKSDF